MSNATDDLARVEDLELALDYALRVLIRFEPPDGRFISDEFVAMASIQADVPNASCRTILRDAIALDDARIADVERWVASAGEAGTAETVKQGSVHEHAAPKEDAQ